LDWIILDRIILLNQSMFSCIQQSTKHVRAVTVSTHTKVCDGLILQYKSRQHRIRRGGPSIVFFGENGKINSFIYTNKQEGLKHRVNGPAEVAFYNYEVIMYEIWKVNGTTHRNYDPATKIYKITSHGSVVSSVISSLVWYNHGMFIKTKPLIF